MELWHQSSRVLLHWKVLRKVEFQQLICWFQQKRQIAGILDRWLNFCRLRLRRPYLDRLNHQCRVHKDLQDSKWQLCKSEELNYTYHKDLDWIWSYMWHMMNDNILWIHTNSLKLCNLLDMSLRMYWFQVVDNWFLCMIHIKYLKNRSMFCILDHSLMHKLHHQWDSSRQRNHLRIFRIYELIFWNTYLDKSSNTCFKSVVRNNVLLV